MVEVRMSNKEVNRISILDQLKRKVMKQKRAAYILGISIRQVRRLLEAYRRDGANSFTLYKTVHLLGGLIWTSSKIITLLSTNTLGVKLIHLPGV